jgi:hypothetical protein
MYVFSHFHIIDMFKLRVLQLGHDKCRSNGAIACMHHETVISIDGHLLTHVPALYIAHDCKYCRGANVCARFVSIEEFYCICPKFM